MAPKRIEIAWAAGIIDGEGCIFISRRLGEGCKQHSYALGIKVTMGHALTVHRMYEIFGVGSLHKVQQPKKKYNLAYTWLASSRMCEDVLKLIKPYCVAKAEEILVAQEFLALPGWYGGQFRGKKSAEYVAREYDLWDRMRRLKPRTAYRLEREGERLVKDSIHRPLV